LEQQVKELEQENEHLEREHLVMLKQQDAMVGGKTKESS
jgi:hypothetical protein